MLADCVASILLKSIDRMSSYLVLRKRYWNFLHQDGKELNLRDGIHATEGIYHLQRREAAISCLLRREIGGNCLLRYSKENLFEPRDLTRFKAVHGILGVTHDITTSTAFQKEVEDLRRWRSLLVVITRKAQQDFREMSTRKCRQTFNELRFK